MMATFAAAKTDETPEPVEISLEEIEVEWQRQLKLRREEDTFYLSLVGPQPEPSLFEAMLASDSDPLSVTLVDDDSAFRIGALLQMRNHPVTKLSLHIPASSSNNHMTMRGAHALVHGLKRSKVVQLELEWEHPLEADVKSSPWQAILLEGAINAVPELHVHNGWDDALVERIARHLVKNRSNATLQKLRFRLCSPLLTEAGAQKLADGFHQAQIKTLEFWACRGFTSPTTWHASKILAPQAVLTAKVQTLVLSYPFENNEADALGEALVGNTSLKSLSFTLGCCMTEESAMVLANGIRQSQVTHLAMEGDDEYDSNWHAEEILYREAIQRSPTIRHLCLGTGLCLNATESFARCLSALHSLEVNRDYREDEYHHNESLFDNLTTASQLQSLTIEHDLLPRELIYLSAVLPQLSSLTHLTVNGNLTCNEVEDLVDEEGVMETADHYDDEGNRIPLAYSELAARNIQGFAAGHLMLAIATHPALSHLDLSGSTDIGFLGLSMIGYLLPFVQLQEFRLEGLTDMFAQAYSDDDDDDDEDDYEDDDDVQAAQARAFQLLVDGVRSNRHLQKVVLDEKHFASAVVEEINFQLEVNKFGKYLTDEELACGVWSHILAKCHDNVGIMFYLLREQPILLVEGGTPASGRAA